MARILEVFRCWPTLTGSAGMLLAAWSVPVLQGESVRAQAPARLATWPPDNHSNLGT